MNNIINEHKTHRYLNSFTKKVTTPRVISVVPIKETVHLVLNKGVIINWSIFGGISVFGILYLLRRIKSKKSNKVMVEVLTL